MVTFSITMSTTATSINAKEHLIKFLGQVCYLYMKDLSFIPADKFDASPMGVARTPLNITVECISFNDWARRTIEGETVEMHGDFSAFNEQFNTVEKASAGMQESTDKLVAALSALDDEGLNRLAPVPWDPTMTVFGLAHTAATHVFYHDGQLNYIQCMLGDDKIHWMGD